MNADDPRDPDIDAAYRATARDEPPRALDERILAAAHRAVHARPVPAGRSFAQRWRVPVALAATVVVSATLTLMVYEAEKAPPIPEEPQAGKSLRDDRNAPAPAASGRAQDPRPAELQERSREAPQRAAPPREEDALRQRGSPPPDSTRSSEARRAPAPFPVEPARPAAPPAAASPPPPAAQREKNSAAPLAKKREAPAAAREGSRELRSETMPREQTPAGASGVGAASAPAPEAERPDARIQEGALADRPTDRLERDTATAADRSALRTPEEWIAEIRRLKRAGRTEDAQRALAEFRVRFPGLRLPEDLQ